MPIPMGFTRWLWESWNSQPRGSCATMATEPQPRLPQRWLLSVTTFYWFGRSPCNSAKEFLIPSCIHNPSLFSVPATSESSSWQPQGSVTFALLSSFQRHSSSITGKSEVQWSMRKGKCFPAYPKGGLPWRWHLLGDAGSLSEHTAAQYLCPHGTFQLTYHWAGCHSKSLEQAEMVGKWSSCKSFLLVAAIFELHFPLFLNRSGFDPWQANWARRPQSRGLALLYCTRSCSSGKAHLAWMLLSTSLTPMTSLSLHSGQRQVFTRITGSKASLAEDVL